MGSPLGPWSSRWWDMAMSFILADEGVEHPLQSRGIASMQGHSPAAEKEEEEGRRGPPVGWGELWGLRTCTPASCFLQGSPFPFTRCGGTEQALISSLSPVGFKPTEALPPSPTPGFSWFPWLPPGCFSSEKLEREACPWSLRSRSRHALRTRRRGPRAAVLFKP